MQGIEHCSHFEMSFRLHTVHRTSTVGGTTPLGVTRVAFVVAPGDGRPGESTSL